jgi:protein subunit release factor A
VNATLRARLERAVVRLEELNGLLAAEEATRDMEQFKKLSREHAEMSGLAALFARYRRAEGDAQAAKDMAGEAAMKGFADEELRNARAEMQRLEAELQKSLLPRDPNDERSRIEQPATHTHTFAAFAHTPLKQIADTELAPDLLHVNGLPPIDEHRIAGDDKEPTKP